MSIQLNGTEVPPTPDQRLVEAVDAVERAVEEAQWLNRTWIAAYGHGYEPATDEARAQAAMVRAAQMKAREAGVCASTYYAIATDQGADSPRPESFPDLYERLLALPRWAVDPSELFIPERGAWDDYEPAHPLTTFIIDWGEFWDAETATDEWLLEPLLATGRAHALYAGAKTGKSYLILAACAALATGRPFLLRPASEPTDVLYVDYEMTQDDLRDRLSEFGYGPEDDLSHLHYALLPSLPGLDTAEGGEALLVSAEAVGAQLVVIDTTGRALEGEENDNDAIRAYYRHTGARLKGAGITVIRLDHAGKDRDKGQRGASAKNDDVDVVWKLTRRDDGHLLEATHRRVSWVPEKVEIEIKAGSERTTFGLLGGDQRGYVEGTKAVADELDRFGAPVEISQGKAGALLREHGVTAANAKLRDALRYRRQMALEATAEAVDNYVKTAPFSPRRGPGAVETARSTARSQKVNENGGGAVDGANGAVGPGLFGAAPLYKSGARDDPAEFEATEAPDPDPVVTLDDAL